MMSSNDYCRLCGNLSENLADVFVKNDFDLSAAYKIRTMLSISIMAGDKLSHCICRSCNDKMEECYLFTKQCQQVQIRLSQAENSETVSILKLEIEDSDVRTNCIENIKMEHTESTINENDFSVEEQSVLVADTDNINQNDANDNVCSPMADKSSAIAKAGSVPTLSVVRSNQTESKKISYSKLAKFLRSKVTFSSETEKDLSSKKDSRLNALAKLVLSEKAVSNPSKNNSTLASRINALVKISVCQRTESKALKDVSSSSRANALQNLVTCEETTESSSSNILDATTLDSNSTTKQKLKLAEKIFKLKSKGTPKSATMDNVKRVYAKSKDENFVKCPYCGEVFAREEFKTDHMILHTDDEELHKIILEHVAPTPVIKLLDCKECHAPFNRELAYIEHMNQHANLRPVKCHLCDRKFFGHKKTRAHVRAHLLSTFKCKSCPYMAKTSQDLRKHQRGVHTNERIMCNVCGKLLSAFEHNMKKHLETHNETRPYTCDICGSCFKTRAGVARHRENLHFPVSIMCSLCGAICGSKQKYKKHIYKCRRKGKKAEDPET